MSNLLPVQIDLSLMEYPRMDRRRAVRRVVRGASVLGVVLPILYLTSIGSVLQLWGEAGYVTLGGRSYAVYEPIWWLTERSDLCRRAVRAYLNHWEFLRISYEL